MTEHLLLVLTSDSDLAPARICGLLAQRNIATMSIQMAKPPGTSHWLVQLVVCVDSLDEAELVVKRLNRLVDVVKVVDVSSNPNHQRRSVFVELRPAAHELIHVSEVARLFSAEVVEVSSTATTLYLSATPSRCDEFLSLLKPYNIVESILSAVSGIRAGPTGAYPWTPHVSRSDLFPAVRIDA